MELKDVVDIILKINAGAYSFEAANPRHEHEWRVWEDVKLPDGAILIPGVITPVDRAGRAPRAGRRAHRALRRRRRARERHRRRRLRLRARSPARTEIHPSVVWAKLEALVEGARIASERLW